MLTDVSPENEVQSPGQIISEEKPAQEEAEDNENSKDFRDDMLDLDSAEQEAPSFMKHHLSHAQKGFYKKKTTALEKM